MFYHTKQGAVNVFVGEGPLNSSNAEQLLNLAHSVLHAGQPRAVVDLADVPLVDGQALEVLLDIHDLCMEGGGQLRLASASPLVQDILEVTEVSAVVEHHSNATLAVGSFAR